MSIKIDDYAYFKCDKHEQELFFVYPVENEQYSAKVCICGFGCVYVVSNVDNAKAVEVLNEKLRVEALRSITITKSILLNVMLLSCLYETIGLGRFTINKKGE